MRNIVLCGFMGTGKTQLGKALAQRLGLPFVDIDGEIERTTGMKIADIFEKMGEPFFRDLEEKLLREYGSKSGQIISVGGGALQRESNITSLRQNGFLVCLFAKPQVILRRLRDDDTRPLLKSEDKLERIESLLRLRFTNYLKADAFLDTSYKTIALCLDYLSSLTSLLYEGKIPLDFQKAPHRWAFCALEQNHEKLFQFLSDPDVSVRFTSAVKLWKSRIPIETKHFKTGRNIFLKWLLEEVEKIGDSSS
ncbi:AAA family ATPase [bacterium]|nr:AAA family ATPase [bacterium]